MQTDNSSKMNVRPTSTSPQNSCHDNPYRVVNVNDRDIYFNGGVTSDSMMDLVKELKHCERKRLIALKAVKRELKTARDKLKPEDIDHVDIGKISPQPINLHINSDGGSVFDVFFAVDEIKNLKVPVHTIVSGMAASAATILSCAGTKRYITKHAHMLIHEIRSGCWGKKSEIEEHFENTTKLSKLLLEYYKDATHMTTEDLAEILKHDYYWDAAQCLEKGLVDEIM